MRSSRGGRERKMLLVAVAVASGVTVSCGPSGQPVYADGIGLFDSGWNQMFDAAAHDAGQPASDATADAADDSSTTDAP